MNYTKGSPYPSKSSYGLIKPEILVMHTTEGYGRSYLDKLFSGQITRDGTQRISVHWCVYRDGSIVEYAPWKPGEAVKCIHAGASSWKGRSSCNGWSLGIEIEHKAGDAYPEVQLQAVIDLVRMIRREWPDMEMVEHKQISPGRKPDPTAPWDEIKHRIYGAWNAPEEEDMTPAQEALLKRGVEALEELVRLGTHQDNTVSQLQYIGVIGARLLAGREELALDANRQYGERWKRETTPL